MLMLTPKANGRPRTCSVNEAAFDNADACQQAAYFVGLLMADGCITKSRHGTRWQIKLKLSGDDGRMVYALRDFLESTFRVSTRTPTSAFANAQPFTETNIASDLLAAALARYGVLPKKSMAGRVSGLGANRHFWRGVIDGDGFLSTMLVSKEQRLAPVLGLVGPEKLLEQFRDFVAKHTDARSNVCRMHSIHNYRIAGVPAYRMIRVLYDDCEIALPRKLSLARALLAKCDYYAERRPGKYEWLTADRFKSLYRAHGSWRACARAVSMDRRYFEKLRHQAGVQ